MRSHAINILDIAQKSHVRDTLGFMVKGCAAGRDVHIIGSGPSALNYVHDPDAYVIVCNAAVQTYGYCADLHVMIEENVWAFPWAMPYDGMECKTVLDVGCAARISDELRDSVGEGWWSKAIWTRRTKYTDGQDLSEVGGGPVQVSIYGGVALCALHIGQMASPGADTHLWGTEFYFPDGKQHYYGDQYYQPGDQLTSVVHFDIHDGEPVRGDGPYTSTPYFIESSKAIRHVAKCSGLTIVDHSGGLLEPEKIGKGA